MDEIINRIIEVEKKAQSMTEQSRQGLETAKKDIKNKIAKLEKEYAEAAEEVLQITQEEQQAEAQREKAEIETAFKTANEKLDNAYLAGRDNWIEEIVSRTINK